MKFYAGPQTGDRRPIGGGEHNKKNIGHEIFNFADFGGSLYGFVRAQERRINLERIDPAAGNRAKLDDVLVVFVAKQRIVGWYRSASAYKTARPFPVSVSKQMGKRLKQSNTRKFKLENYQFESSTDNAVLLPTHERTHAIPANLKAGFGQSNVCYLYGSDGKRKPGLRMNRAIRYVLNYGKENLLKNPIAEQLVDEAAAISQEQSCGFQSDPVIRKRIEEFAMLRALSKLERKYSNFKRTAEFKPYDYTCVRGGKTFFVEVKGTETPGRKVILTKREVEHVRNNPDRCILVLVHSIHVSPIKQHVSGGTTEVKEPWRLQSKDLSPIDYVWTVH